MTARRLLVGALLASLAGCAHVGPGTGDPRDPHVLYPLVAGRTWTFRVTRPGAAGRGTTVTRVDSVSGHTVTVRSGTHRYAYALKADGVYRPDQHAYLLKGPVTKGASWPAPFGGTVTVTAVGQTVTVPAGTFHGCVVVDERVPVAHVRQVHTFCPGVGPVKLVQYTDGAMLAEGVLVAFGPGGPPGS